MGFFWTLVTQRPSVGIGVQQLSNANALEVDRLAKSSTSRSKIMVS